MSFLLRLSVTRQIAAAVTLLGCLTPFSVAAQEVSNYRIRDWGYLIWFSDNANNYLGGMGCLRRADIESDTCWNVNSQGAPMFRTRNIGKTELSRYFYNQAEQRNLDLYLYEPGEGCALRLLDDGYVQDASANSSYVCLNIFEPFLNLFNQ